MAITAAERTEMVRVVVGLFDAAPGFKYLNDFIGYAGNPAGLLNELVADPAFNVLYPVFLTNQEFAARYVDSLVGDAASAAAKANVVDYFAAQLNAGASRADVIGEALVSLITMDQNDPTWGAAAKQFANKVVVAEYYSVEMRGMATEVGALQAVIANVDADTDVSTPAAIEAAIAGGEGPVNPIGAIQLTTGTDRGVAFEGTALADVYEAWLGQNAYVGGVSNTLSSADSLDGKGGVDSLYAQLVPEFFGAAGTSRIDIQPTIRSVEQIEFEARDTSGFYDQGEGEGDSDYAGTVIFDAKNVYGVERIGSTNSDGDLVIENLNTLTSDGSTKRNTDAITITMDHTDNFNSDGDASDLTVYFDDNYLLSGQTAEAQAFFFLLDEDADLAGNPNRLDRINVDGIRFSLDGGTTVIDLDDVAAQNAGTHEGFVAALQAKLAQLIADGTVPAGTTLTVDPTITDTTFLDNGQQSEPIPAIVLTIGDGTQVTPIGYSQVADAIGEYDVYGRFNALREVAEQPISVNVELTKVGRGDDGGDLIIGAKSQHAGISVFDVTVMGGEILPNSLGTLGTTGSMLDVVNIKSEAGRTEDFASLEIRDGFGQGSLDLVNANEFYGDLTLGSGDDVDNLVTLTATGGGDVAFFGQISDVINNDTGRAHSYTTGAGDDWVEVNIGGDAVDAVGESLTITTGAGDDVVDVQLNDGVSQRTMNLLDNLSISTGAGEDAVYVWGMGLFDISTGADSDFVEIDSSIGNNVFEPSNNAAADNGEWVFGTSTGAQTFVARVLYQADLTVKFAGFESTVRVNTTAANNFVATQLDINAAIMAAIDASPELWALLGYETGSAAQQLFVTALVNGSNDLGISLYQPELLASGTAGVGQTVVSGSVLQQIAQGIIATTDADSDDFNSGGAFSATAAADVFNNGTGVTSTNIGDGSLLDTGVVANGGVAGLGVNDRGIYDFLDPDLNTGGANGLGTDENDLNFSVVNLGAGANDLVVLDNNDGSANTIVIDQTFGKVSVVNFFLEDSFAYDTNGVGTDVADVGLHRLDFTAYLNNQLDASTGIPGNAWSAVPLAVTLNADASAEANSVSILGFDGAVLNSVSFASLSGANLKAVLNGDAGAPVVGGLADGSLNAVTSTLNLVGTVQNHIVLVENEQNQGEYKVFHLTSVVSTPDNGGDFADVTLLGTLDFGYSIDGAVGVGEVNLVGSAGYLALDLPFPVLP